MILKNQLNISEFSAYTAQGKIMAHGILGKPWKTIAADIFILYIKTCLCMYGKAG